MRTFDGLGILTKVVREVRQNFEDAAMLFLIDRLVSYLDIVSIPSYFNGSGCLAFSLVQDGNIWAHDVVS